MESPRDLQLPDEITQYSPLEGSMENTADVLLLVRPDYTIYDELRKNTDFNIFADMRLAGVGMIGVVHATRPIDAIQRIASRVELGVIPCGSANDFLKFFKSREKFLDIAAQIDGEAIEMDLIKAGNKYCLNGCSVGMDAVVARDMSIFKRWPMVSGSFAYTLAIVKTFLGKLGITANISVDGETPQRKNCLFAVIANAPYYGGGYKGAPEAVPYDNKLDFTLVDKISKLKILKFLGIYKKGEHKKLDCCTLKNCTSMEFASEKPIPVNLDGEIIETTNMKFELVKSAVKFVVPKGVANKLLTKV